MKIKDAYHQAIQKLKNPEVDEINVRILLCEINELPTMSSFYIAEDEDVKDLRRFNELFERFLNGEPVQYLINKSNFFGYDFYVDKRVLIPRQESEEVVAYAIDKAKEIFEKDNFTILDVCCGSGCLGITLSRCLNAEKLYLSDISKDALEVAKKNLKLNGIEGETLLGDGLSKAIEQGIKCDILIANPPYIVNRDDVDPSVMNHEPHLALFADKKLSVYDSIISNLTKIANKPFMAVFEIGYDITPVLEGIVKKHLHKAHYEIIKDMNGKNRILSVILK